MYQQNLPPQGMNYYQAAYPTTPQQQQYMQRLAMQEQYTPQMQQGNFLKGRPVVSIEEARAAQIDLDGSMFIFTDIGNKKIYTKQINLDGTATLNVYSLEENGPATLEEKPEYVTKAEFNQALSQIEAMFQKAESEDKKSSIPLNF